MHKGNTLVLPAIKPSKVTLALNRSGVIKTKLTRPNQCKEVGHTKYAYEARIVVLPKLDKEGFIIDHKTVHEAVENVFQTMSSCEKMALLIARSIERACVRHGCKLVRIYLKIRPIPKSAKDKVMAFMEVDMSY